MADESTRRGLAAELRRLDTAAQSPAPWRWEKTGRVDCGYVDAKDCSTLLFGERGEGAVADNDPQGKLLAFLRNHALDFAAALEAQEAPASKGGDSVADNERSESDVSDSVAPPASGPAPGAGEQRIPAFRSCAMCGAMLPATELRVNGFCSEECDRQSIEYLEADHDPAPAPPDLEAKLREGEDLVAVSGTHARMEAWIAWALSTIRSLRAELQAAKLRDCGTEDDVCLRPLDERLCHACESSWTMANAIADLDSQLQAAKAGRPAAIMSAVAKWLGEPHVDKVLQRLQAHIDAAQAQPPAGPIAPFGVMNMSMLDCNGVSCPEWYVCRGGEPAICICEDEADAHRVAAALNAQQPPVGELEALREDRALLDLLEDLSRDGWTLDDWRGMKEQRVCFTRTSEIEHEPNEVTPAAADVRGALRAALNAAKGKP